MEVSKGITARKAVTASHLVIHSDLSLIERYILNRYDISASLARTIACVAMLGDRS